MLVAVLIYFLIGAVVALFAAAQRGQPREKEIGDWMLLMSGSPFTILAAMVLWPLWLLFMCFPQKSFLESKSSVPDSPPDYIGKLAEVVIPLTPVGRVSIDGNHRDARAESGSISEGTQVLVCSRSVGDELIVREAIQAVETTETAARPPRLT